MSAVKKAGKKAPARKAAAKQPRTLTSHEAARLRRASAEVDSILDGAGYGHYSKPSGGPGK
jgi:hypothetical protein